MVYSAELLAAIARLPVGHKPTAAYRLLRKYGLPSDQPPPPFPHLSPAVNRRLAWGIGAAGFVPSAATPAPQKMARSISTSLIPEVDPMRQRTFAGRTRAATRRRPTVYLKRFNWTSP